MPKHILPTSFNGLAAVILDIYSRLESLERRPRFGIARVTLTADSTLDPVTRYVWVSSAGNITVTLPDQWDGATVSIKNTVNVTTTVLPVSGTVDGSSSATVFGLNVLKTFQSDGTNWISL